MGYLGEDDHNYEYGSEYRNFIKDNMENITVE
jgi:hypothetical protein